MILSNLNLIKSKKNIGLLYILSIYYLINIINLKLNSSNNFFSFYTKEERLTSIGNYQYYKNNYNFLNFIKNINLPLDQLYFSYKNIIDFYNINNDLIFYLDIYKQVSKLKLNKIQYLNLFT